MEIYQPPPNLSFTSGNLSEQWRRWEQQFRVYYTAAELVKKEAKTRVAILLHCAGHRIFTVTLCLVTLMEMANDCNSVLKKTGFCSG